MNHNDKNHRCSICDYVAFDSDGSTRYFRHDKATDDYVCSECAAIIYDTLAEFGFDEQIDADLLECLQNEQKQGLQTDPVSPGVSASGQADGPQRSNLGLLEALAVDGALEPRSSLAKRRTQVRVCNE